MPRKIFLTIIVSLICSMSVLPQGTSTTAAADKSDPAKKPAVFRPTKDQIQKVQAMLKEKKLYTGEASGTYNDETRTGIKSFQKDNGLKETGTLNRATLEKFGVELTDNQKLIPVSDSSFASGPSDSSAKTTKTASSAEAKPTNGDSAKELAKVKPAIFRATVDQIKAAQKLLKGKSMYSGEESGKLDDDTRDGLKKYQEGNGLKVTGTLNAVTLEKMGIPLNEKQKLNAAATDEKKP